MDLVESMIDRMPREGYGYGIIRLSHLLASVVCAIADLELISMTDMMGELKDRGVFDRVKSGLHLPEDYTIHGVYIEPLRRTWCVLVEAPDVPIPDEGEMLPVLTPIYTHTWDFEKGTHQARLERIDIAKDPYHVLRVD